MPLPITFTVQPKAQTATVYQGDGYVVYDYVLECVVIDAADTFDQYKTLRAAGQAIAKQIYAPDSALKPLIGA